MLKKLAYILGPLVVALMLVLVTIFAFPSRLPHSLIAEKRSAVAITNNSFKNSLVKRQALDDPKHRFVPFLVLVNGVEWIVCIHRLLLKSTSEAIVHIC